MFKCGYKEPLKDCDKNNFVHIHVEIYEMKFAQYTIIIITLLINNKLVGQGYYKKTNPWADSVLKTMSLEEKIGQLFMVAAFSNKDTAHVGEISRLVSDYKIGGLIFFKGGPVRQANLTNYYQSKAKIPLMIGIDGEWGLSMRLDSTTVFPKQMQLGAMQSDTLVYKMGVEIARQCKRMGIHINFAPVADVNNNPLNPVISDRSFGEDKTKVTRFATAYMKGMQNTGIMACAKHFPGHGDVSVDSHKDLPVIFKTEAELDSLELFPFKKLFAEGIMSTMVAHLNLPNIDTTTNLASTLSTKVVKGLLRDKLGFEGLAFTDALNMKGASKYFAPGEVDLRALIAGNDILLYSENIPSAIRIIIAAIDSGMLSVEELDQHVLKILKAKYWCGLHNYLPIETDHLFEDLNTPQTAVLLRQMSEQSVFVVNNVDRILPIPTNPNLKIASIAIGSDNYNQFQMALLNYHRVTCMAADKFVTERFYDNWLERIEPFDIIIISLHGTSRFLTKEYGIPYGVQNFVNLISQRKKVILVDFSNVYSLEKFPDQRNVILGYEENENNFSVAAQIAFGALPSLAKLPVSVGSTYSIWQASNYRANERMKYGIPEMKGLNSKNLSKIDSIVAEGIRMNAFPGCQVLVARDGVVVYQKSFGNFTYDATSPSVKNSDLYDLASITKVAATNLQVMKLYEQKKITLDKKVSDYIKEAKGTTKAGVTIKQLLLHEGGLKAWIPFYKEAYKNNVLDSQIFSKTQDYLYFYKVADSLYINRAYHYIMWSKIYNSEMTAPGQYVYSDLDFMFLKKIIEKTNNNNFEDLISKTFYQPLGLTSMGFTPLNHFQKNEIAPTEEDKVFRKQLLQGNVHDQAAAMFGGVSGHAGLFGNANDLAVVFQMLLNKGTYNRIKYFEPSTVELFTSYQSQNSRRGLGFDKPERGTGKQSPTCESASPLTFGHTGFTGTCVWADPHTNLVYVFLSNRIHPNQDNNAIINLNIRTRIQQVIYDSMQ